MAEEMVDAIMNKAHLEGFYESWSGKNPAEVRFDIEAAFRKADVITSRIPARHFAAIRTVFDFGCGYGAFLHRLQECLKGQIERAVGVDYSQAAIDIACREFNSINRHYYKLPYLDVVDNESFLRSLFPQGVDAVMLIDLLEHVPDCKSFVFALSRLTRFFVVKLPIESSVFDNYFMPKEYPSSVHSNGHLREFDANNVYYFVRSLGLTPLYEQLYVYHLDDSFPPPFPGATAKQRAIRQIVRVLKGVLSYVLPTKIFLRLIGGGGYFCIATYSGEHVLDP